MIGDGTSAELPSEAAATVAKATAPPLAGLAVKRAIDIVGALTFFIVFGPLYVLVALCVCIGGGRPVHFCQMRLGRQGRSFRFYKFRSMVLDADRVLERHLAADPAARAEWDAYQKLENDPRILPVGRFLRQLSLDELPQFWNVLIGDMSLVGPRPCMERQRTLYGAAWEHYATMRPGLTGLWQVSRRNQLTFAQRAELDIHYVEHWSLWLDCKILARTVRAVLFDGE